MDGVSFPPSTKQNGGPVDWYTEGPGRRVGYDDLTAIDWIYEYAREKQRTSVLKSSATGVLGYLFQVLDASQIWAVLILTGIATGLIAACINITSDWLGDLKTGICVAGEGGGRFYLSRAFCCWGVDGRLVPDQAPVCELTLGLQNGRSAGTGTLGAASSLCHQKAAST